MLCKVNNDTLSMNEKYRGKEWRRWFLETGMILLLSAAPLVILNFSFESGFAREMSAMREEQSFNLDRIFQLYSGPKAMFDFIASSFAEMSAMIEKPMSVDVLLKEMAQRKARFPGVFEAVLFDADNRLVASGSDLPEFHAVMNDFARDYVLFNDGMRQPFERNFANYRPFVGPNPRYFKPYAEYYYREVNFGRKRGMVLFSKWKQNRPWFMVWISFPKDGRELAFRLGEPPSIWFREQGVHDVIDIDNPSATAKGKLGKAGIRYEHLLPFLGESDGKITATDGFLWTQVRINQKTRLLLAIPDQGLKSFEKARKNLHLTILLVTLFPALVLPKLDRFGPLSLRTKIVGLFLYTTGVPLILLFISAKGLFQDRQQVMEKSIYNAQEEAISALNRQTLDYQGWLEAVALKKKGELLPMDATATRRAVSRFSKLSEVADAFLGVLFDERGDTVCRSGKSHSQLLEKMIPVFGVQVARRCAEMNQTELSQKYVTREQAIRASIESFGFEIDEIGGIIERAVDSFFGATIGATRLLALNVRFFDQMQKLRFVGFLFWDEKLYRSSLKRCIPRFQKNLAATTEFSFFDDGIYPAGFAHAEKMGDLSILLARQATPVHLRFAKEGQTYYMTGMKGDEISAALFAVTSDQSIHDEMMKKALRFGFLGVFILGLGGGIGLLISRNFLRPVVFLAQGMESMKARDFSRRVKVLGDDEFGRLTASFNHMMEKMGELEVARVVQDTFFPQDSLVGEGWEVFGTSVSASRVGGDYYDYFPLPDGRWLILIGDVAGHGVPAALVVAMAKALVYHPANPPSPAKIMDILNLQIFKTLGGKRLMSCFLGFFDPRTGEFVAVNAGHNYPYLIKPGGIEEMNIQNSLLGTRRQKPYTEHFMLLGRQDIVCFYTDGLIEALDEKGNMIGYERFSGELPRLMGKKAGDTEQNIRAWFKKVAAPGPLEDDITLVILQRPSS